MPIESPTRSIQWILVNTVQVNVFLDKGHFMTRHYIFLLIYAHFMKRNNLFIAINIFDLNAMENAISLFLSLCILINVRK